MIPGETLQSQKALGMKTNSHYSEYQVLRSGGGYYIGTIWTACGECEECKKDGYDKGTMEPGSRETDYMTLEQAEKTLEHYKKTGELLEQR